MAFSNVDDEAKGRPTPLLCAIPGGGGEVVGRVGVGPWGSERKAERRTQKRGFCLDFFKKKSQNFV